MANESSKLYMKILYINHYAGSIHHGMEYRPYYLAREWVNAGHDVTIVASNLSHLRQKNIELAVNEQYLDESIDGIRYFWCKTSPYVENGIKRVINIFSFLHRVWKLKDKIANGQKFDLVIASSTYPFDTVLAKKIANEHGAKFVYEVHDLWPLTPIEVGGMSKWHPFIMLMQLAENYGYKNADKVVSLLPKACDYMIEHGMDADKFVYISNGVVVSDWLNSTKKIPNEHQILFAKLHQIENKFVIGYAGGMGESNALIYLLKAAELLKDKPIAFVLVGDGILKESLQDFIKINQLTNVYFMPAISKLQIPSFLSECDVLYIGWSNLPIYRFGICPNKLFDYMLSKKPIIHSVTAGNDLVEEADCGISVPAEDISAIAQAISIMSSHQDSVLDKFGKNGYNYVLSHHDYRVLATRFIDSLSD